jgi:hypothetical protein
MERTGDLFNLDQVLMPPAERENRGVGKMRKKLARGTVFKVPVTRERIDESVPCDKNNCMLAVAFKDFLDEEFGRGNYYISAVTNGVKFTKDGRRYDAYFNRATTRQIFNYDRTFRANEDEGYRSACSIARSSIRPFTATLIVGESKKIADKMTPEQLARWKESRLAREAEKKAAGFKRIRRATTGREISM